MNVLILGSGGREHAIATKITESNLLNKLFVATGNAGTSLIGKNVDIDINDFVQIKKECISNNIDLVIVGPEAPLVNGIYDYLINDKDLQNIKVFGPSKKAAQLEGSKEFAKKFLVKNNIPTARYKSFNKNEINQAFEFLETLSPPFVLKADGLAGGKGVVILNNLYDAKEELSEMLSNNKFGQASSRVVIEEFLDGIELSCFVVTDGVSYKILPFAKDYKRIFDGDKGLNTGGMGAVSPVPFIDSDFYTKIEEQIVKPTILGLKKDNLDYKGVIFIGLIKVGNNPFVIEYNVRFGDPETEVVLPRITSDVLELFDSIASAKLNDYQLKTTNKTALTVMLVSKGYPGKYEKEKQIKNLDKVSESVVFHAGTKKIDDKVVTNGGRVLAITSFGNNIIKAREKSYKNAELIGFDGKFYRKDIGLDLV
jgi:phosphoribosylamine--glycine ligase